MESLSVLKSRSLAIALAVFSLALAAACSGEDDEGPSATGATGTGGQAVEYNLADEQVLRLSMKGEPGTIDPHLASVDTEISVVRQLTTGLFTYDEDLNIVPALAKTIPTVENGGISEDGTTYTVELKETTWSDGTPLTAGDFVYSMLRALDPSVASPYAWAFYDIAGAHEYNTSLDPDNGSPAPPASEVEALRSQVGVRAEDDHTIVYSLIAPNPAFLNMLALFTAAPVKQDLVETHGDAWTQPGNFVGNGPFVLDSWERGGKIVLARNDAWYGPAPTLTSIEVTFMADDAVAHNAYTNGELHSVRATPASLAGGANRDELVITPELGTHALFMNGASEPFDNPLVRQAFGSAIDRDAFVNGVLQGTGAPTTSWVPPGMPGYNSELGSNMSFDPERAKELLAEAGYPAGRGFPQATFIMVGSDQGRITGQFLESQLETNLGIDVSFEYYDEGQYYDEFFAGNFGATIQSWFADWPAPDNFLYGLFHSNGGANIVGYSNPEYDKLLDDAAAAADQQKRLELYDRAQALLLQDAAIAPLYNEINTTFVKPNVLDLVITGIDGALKGDGFFWKTKITVPNGN